MFPYGRQEGIIVMWLTKRTWQCDSSAAAFLEVGMEQACLNRQGRRAQLAQHCRKDRSSVGSGRGFVYGAPGSDAIVFGFGYFFTQERHN